jgi:hypothetical protein
MGQDVGRDSKQQIATLSPKNKTQNSLKFASILFHSSSSFGFVEIDSLRGQCFFHFFLGISVSQDGTSQPEAVITLAMFRKYGISCSV